MTPADYEASAYAEPQPTRYDRLILAVAVTMLAVACLAIR